MSKYTKILGVDENVPKALQSQIQAGEVTQYVQDGEGGWLKNVYDSSKTEISSEPISVDDLPDCLRPDMANQGNDGLA